MPNVDTNLDAALDRIEAFLGLLSFLQDECEPRDRVRLSNAEGYIVEMLLNETAQARQSFAVIFQARAANGRRAS